jgi:porin
MRYFLTIILITFGFYSPALGQEAPSESLAEQVEALEEGATLFPIPDYTSGILARDALTGDWNGERTSLAKDYGLQFELDVNQIYQGVMDGGENSNDEYYGSAYYALKFDTGQAGLWPGGFLEVRGETYWGKSVNPDTGGLLTANVNDALRDPAGNGTYLPHVIYTQFLAENFAFFVGKLNTTVGDSNSFAHGVGDQRFMNLAFSLNPVGLTTGPYAPLGVGFVFIPFERVAYSFSVIDSNGKIDESGFNTVLDGDYSFINELKITTNFFGRPGHQTVGFVYSIKEFSSIDQRIALPPGTDRSIATEDDSWAFIYNFDQYLVSDPDDPEQGWGLFGRVGISDGDANLLHRFYSIGVGGTGLFPGRDRDRFGLGYYFLDVSNNRVGIATSDDEQGAEIFYNFVLTPAVELTADLQIIDGAVRSADTAVVGGLRARLRF